MRSDAELHEEAMAGGSEAFAPIVERYADAVFGVALARLGDFHAAQDVAQQAFLEAVAGRSDRPEVTAEEGLAAMECAEAILVAIKKHKW